MKRLLLLLVLCSGAVLAADPHSATLGWTDSQVATYNLYRSNGICSGTPTFGKVNLSPITLKTYVDLTVQAGITYCYVVTAVVGTEESAYSNTAQAVIPKDPTYPPTGLTVKVQ